MPNYAYHNVEITGPAEERERFLAECFTAGDLDFNRIIPQPEHIIASSKVRHRITKEDPFPDWYHWRCEHWGDKWDAGDTEVSALPDRIMLSFATAWSVPAPVFEEIARRYPRLSMTGTVQEGQFGWRATIGFRDGEFYGEMHQITAEEYNAIFEGAA
jgi:hypothetical protein